MKVTLVSNSRPPLIPETTWLPVQSLELGVLHRFRHVPDEYLFARSSGKALIESDRADPFDLVLFHAHSALVFGGRQVRRVRRIPLALVAHGDIFDCPPGAYDRRMTAFYRYSARHAFRMADLFVALSPAMVEGAANLGKPVPHVEIIPNGIDLRSIGISPESVHRSFDGDPLRLLFIGRLAAEKGIEQLLEAVATIPEVDLRLDVIGAGSLDSRVREFAARSGGRVVFHGSKPRAELGSFYLDAHLLCVPSLSDPLPGVVLESFASGTSVLGTDAGGIPFMIRNGTDGCIVPRGDVAALASAIAGLSRDRERLAAMGRRARESVEARFSWRHVGDLLGTAIRTAIERSRRNQPGSRT